MAESRTKSDMSHARQRASVSCVNLQKFLWGDEQWTTRQRIVEIISNDPIFDKSSRPFSSRQERYKRGLAMANRIYELRELHKWSAKETSLAFDLIDEPVPMTLHNIAFEPVVMSQGSPELIAKYGALVANRGILGCYLQTELGHGTNVSSLETTATYLPDTQEFEIHSPTLTSSKWWIGGLGKTSTHGVVQARLILPSGMDVGPHLFFVQLRSLKDHSMPSRHYHGRYWSEGYGGLRSCGQWLRSI
ncbi:Peroxisomal acyl-coenzyme A oxidase 1 [Grifola frondosa]|uniref:Peroxisomal acyl-coenzyme A oxidase 1 n=1 Tax=Grifola frondosa TaxID=5627 RepID=A0A1C7MEG4_GRIFR|nr:Peroxisomal acyl-coenzyme A oxidase 1 [Grifola frondosa]